MKVGKLYLPDVLVFQNSNNTFFVISYDRSHKYMSVTIGKTDVIPNGLPKTLYDMPGVLLRKDGAIVMNIIRIKQLHSPQRYNRVIQKI